MLFFYLCAWFELNDNKYIKSLEKSENYTNSIHIPIFRILYNLCVQIRVWKKKKTKEIRSLYVPKSKMASHVSLKNKPMGSIASHIHKLRYPTNTIKNDNFLNRKI